MFDSVLGLLHSAAIKYTPNTTADEEAIEALRKFIKEHPPLIAQAYNIIMMMLKGKKDSDEFKDAVIDFTIDVLLTKKVQDDQFTG